MSTALVEVPETEAIDENLRPILESHCFSRAETQKKMLIYLWNQRGKEISEYAIAIDALGRRHDFDPRTDATVRVQISRLRRKLKDFYETEGRNFPLKLMIPVGSHMLQLDENSSLPVVELPVVVPWVAPRWLFVAISGACMLLLCLSGWLYHSRSEALTAASQHLKEPPIPFWNVFFSGAKKTQIVLPTPVFMKYAAKRGLRVRDIYINDFQNWRSSADLVEVSRYAGLPDLEQAYTVTSDTFASISLARYLDSVGLGSTLTFNNNANTSMTDLESSNEIVLGAHGTLQPFQFYLDRMHFTLTENERSVEARTSASEPKKNYPAVNEGTGRTIEPGIIAVLPGKQARTKLLILQSRRTAALVEMLTSATGSALIEKLRKQNGSPQYYEVVVLAEMNGDHMMRAWPVDFSASTPAHFAP